MIVLSDGAGGGPIVSVVEPLTLPDTAEIVVAPCATDVARPPGAIVAMVVADDSQTTTEVRSLVLPSL